MSKRDMGMEILEGIQAIKAHKAGEPKLRTRTVNTLPTKFMYLTDLKKSRKPGPPSPTKFCHMLPINRTP
jgi:hypothetical protein